MTFDDTRDNTTAIEADIIEADNREDAAFTCNCYQCTTGDKHVGDGPSGFDRWQDTKWCC